MNDLIEIKQAKRNYEISLGDKKYMLKRDTDFGMIKKKDGKPLSTKPTLFKSGAQKILRLLGIPYEIEITDTFKDHEKGYFYYEVLAKSIDQNNRVVRTGVGCSNTNERQNGSASGFDTANSAFKKAEKRALVDLAISLADASDWFTQDLEDVNNSTIAREIKKDSDFIDKDRQEQLFAIAQTNDFTVEEVKAKLKELGYEKTSEITLGKYDEVLANFIK